MSYEFLQLFIKTGKKCNNKKEYFTWVRTNPYLGVISPAINIFPTNAIL